ncbi:MAG: class I SAM-dependent methyltransferase [Clostridia bacterium]|nr:class I SAM-dependent methyltransferase [Clostridia bacterium]
MLALSKRLSLIASLVKSGSRVCDVGTDHGYLPAFLYLSGKMKSVVATDIRKKPLASAKSNLERLEATGVRLILCDGLEAVTRDMADTVIIAGMGGEVISGIIDRAAFLRDSTVELILQPTTAAKELRQYLSKNGFEVGREIAVIENGKIYSVMLVNFTGKPYTLNSVQELIGILKPDSPDAIEYISKQYRIAQKCADDLAKVSYKQEQYNYYLNLSNQLKEILGG